MPPRCPACGRFLSTDLVRSLHSEPAACPRCEVELTAEMFDVGTTAEPARLGAAPVVGADPVVDADPSDGSPDRPSVEAPPESVRPPDLPPDDVREVVGSDDVLAGWDHGPDERTSEGEAVVALSASILAGGVVGGLLGGAVSRRHRSLGAVIGTVLGALAALAGSRALGLPSSR